VEELIEFLSRDTIQLMVNFVSYGIIGLAGAILKELHKSNVRPSHHFDPLNVIISTTVATLLAIFIKQKFADTLDEYWGIMGLVSLILGLVGDEIFRYISTLSGLKKVYTAINTVGDGINESTPDEPEHVVVKKKEKPCPSVAEKVVHVQEQSLKYNVRRPVIHHPSDNEGGD
jgi:hypothetical protein